MESLGILPSSFLQSPAFHIILPCGSLLFQLGTHSPRIHEDFKELHRHVLFVSVFNQFPDFYFHGYSFLSLICVRINLMVLLSHLPFSHFTKEKHVSNSGQSSPWCVVPRYKYLLDIKETIGNIGVDIEKIYYFNDVITNPLVNQVQLALSIHRCETCRLWRADCSFLMPYLKKIRGEPYHVVI